MDTQQTVPSEGKHRSTSLATALLLLAFVVAVFAAWPLLSNSGFLNTRGGGDSPFLLQRLQQLESAIRDGHFPVRWMPDANYGYGYPFYNYYAPLSIYMAAAFRFLGLSLVRSIELAQLTGFLLAAWGMFLLARRWLRNEWSACLASVAYTVAPFHLVNIYVRGDSLAEFWAMAWYPWILLAADSLFEGKDGDFPYGRLASLALAYAALILTHNISALIFTPFFLLYILLRWLPLLRSPSGSEPPQSERGHGQVLLTLLLAILLGLSLAAWFFIPALGEREFAQLGPVTTGYFHYSNHFRGFDLVQATVLFDYSVSGGNAFRLGLVQAIATLLGALALIYAAFRKRSVSLVIAGYILMSLLVATFMVTPLSQFLWNYVPLLQFAQFPWRFLSVQAFAAALTTGALAFLPARRLVVPITGALLVFSSFAGLRTDHLQLTDADVSANRLAEYEWFTANIGSTISAEYLPPTVQPRPYTSSWLHSGVLGNVSALSGDLLLAQELKQKATQQTWQIVAADSGATVLFPTMYWPGWQAEMNGEAVEIQPSPGSGMVMIDLPPGEHLIDLRLGHTPVRLFAELLSLAAVLATILLLVKVRVNIKIRMRIVVPLAFLLVLVVILGLWPERNLTADNLNWDFTQMGYLHHEDAGVSFDNGAVLERYEYDRETALAGEDLTVTLYFAGSDGEEVTLALGTPAISWPVFDPPPPLLAEQTKELSGKSVQFELFLPDDIPAGLVAPRVTIGDARPLTPSGRTRGDLFLRPLRIENDQPAVGSKPMLDARISDVRQRDPNTLDVQLVWVTRQQLSQNYNLSLRLIDGAGNWLAQLDTQPGYGFLPSSGWPVGNEVNDWLAMSLPQNLAPDNPLTLMVQLYQTESGEVVLTRLLGDLTLQEGQLSFEEHKPVFTLTDELTVLTAVFGESIRLHGYQLDQSGSTLHLTFYWEALVSDQPDFTRFVHIFDPHTEIVVNQIDGLPQNNSYPTSQWTEGEIVADAVTLDLADVPPGAYQIGIGFYSQEEAGFPRLTAKDGQSGTQLPSGRASLPEVIER
ncbi:MAG: hypothetical protein GWP61_01565 [Chloroflexi bacterium]|jgi:hypothetical protein|nr:hypothetical protein [Chloroflexota bacterium]